MKNIKKTGASDNRVRIFRFVRKEKAKGVNNDKPFICRKIN